MTTYRLYSGRVPSDARFTVTGEIRDTHTGKVSRCEQPTRFSLEELRDCVVDGSVCPSAHNRQQAESVCTVSPYLPLHAQLLTHLHEHGSYTLDESDVQVTTLKRERTH